MVAVEAAAVVVRSSSNVESRGDADERRLLYGVAAAREGRGNAPCSAAAVASDCEGVLCRERWGRCGKCEWGKWGRCGK